MNAPNKALMPNRRRQIPIAAPARTCSCQARSTFTPGGGRISSSLDMSAKGRLLLAVVVVFGLIGILVVWPTSRKRAGGLSVTFVGLTNDSAGKVLAQFSVANHYPRRVQFGVCEVQVCQTNGWPNFGRVAGGAGWLPVAPGGQRIFSVPPPSAEQASWRVPVPYQEDLSFMENARFRIDLLAWGIGHWRPGKSAPIRHGDSFHRTLVTYGPELAGTRLGAASIFLSASNHMSFSGSGP